MLPSVMMPHDDEPLQRMSCEMSLLLAKAACVDTAGADMAVVGVGAVGCSWGGEGEESSKEKG
jgi:hypothetical protein